MGKVHGRTEFRVGTGSVVTVVVMGGNYGDEKMEGSQDERLRAETGHTRKLDVFNRDTVPVLVTEIPDAE